MAQSSITVNNTVDYVVIAIVAVVLGFVVYEVSQTVQATESVLGGYLGPILLIGGIIGVILAVTLLL
jgi:hypothetical protein